MDKHPKAGWYLPGGRGNIVLVTEFPGMALNGLFCADVLRPLNLVPLHWLYLQIPPCTKAKTKPPSEMIVINIMKK